MKNKLKLEMLTDYVKIETIKKYYIYFTANGLAEDDKQKFSLINSLTAKLKAVYEQIFFKFKVYDDAFFLLNSQIESINLNRPEFSNQKLEKDYQYILLLCQKMEHITKKLSLTEGEKSHIVQQLLSKT